MVQIRRNHQRNDKQKNIVVRLLIIVILFAVSIPLLYRFYTKGIQRNSAVQALAGEELINRTYLPSCEPQNLIITEDNFSFCMDSISGNVAWFASEWQLTSSEYNEDSRITEGVKKYLLTKYTDYANVTYFTDSIFPEALDQFQNSGSSDTLIVIAGPLKKQPVKKHFEKIISFIVAFDPEINNLAVFRQSINHKGDIVWKNTSIDEIEINFGLNFFHHYLPEDVEIEIEMRR